MYRQFGRCDVLVNNAGMTPLYPDLAAVVGKPLEEVFAYLSDFTTTTEWDPGTETTVRQHGDGGVSTTYLNTSVFLGRKTRLTYTVHEFIPDKRGRVNG